MKHTAPCLELAGYGTTFLLPSILRGALLTRLWIYWIYCSHGAPGYVSMSRRDSRVRWFGKERVVFASQNAMQVAASKMHDNRTGIYGRRNETLPRGQSEAHNRALKCSSYNLRSASLVCGSYICHVRVDQISCH